MSPPLLMEILTMMKIYIYAGFPRQYEEGKQPEGAVEIKAETPPKDKKAKKPVNKTRQVKNK